MAVAHAICHANTKGDYGNGDGFKRDHAVIVVAFTDRTKNIDTVCNEAINSDWGGCGVVKDNYFTADCPAGGFLSTTGACAAGGCGGCAGGRRSASVAA